MLYQWGRFIWWLGQSQNAAVMQVIAAVIVTLVTAWYTFLTHWIMKATAKQASAALQPVLALYKLAKPGDDTFHTLVIQNSSDRPVVFLDVVISCHPMGYKAIVHKLRGWDDQILSARDNTQLHLDFSKELAALRINAVMCGFKAELVVSDLSRQVAIQYEHIWVVGRFSCRVGLPWKVRWRYRIRPWGWRYHRVKSRFSSK